MSVRSKFLVILLALATGISAQTTLTDPNEIAKALPGNRVPGARTYDRSAELVIVAAAIEQGKLELAEQRLARMAQALPPSPEWYVMLSLLNVAKRDTAAAAVAIASGLKAYPYSKKLGVFGLGFAIDRGRYHTIEDVMAAEEFPLAARSEIAMKLAVRDKDYTRAILLAERTAYAEGSMPHETSVANALGTTQLLLFDTASVAKQLAGWLTHPPGSLEDAYQTCLVDAAHALAERGAVATDLHDAVGQLRAATLRLFADRGHLGRYPDPLLVDLYVLDLAGHLAASTAELYQAFKPNQYETYWKTHRRELRQAERYRQEQWGADVDVFLARIE